MSTMTIPDRHAQRIEALRIAERRRMSLVAWRREVHALGYGEGLRHAAVLLADDPDRVAAMTVYRFLDAIPGVGDSTIRTLLYQRGWLIWPMRRVRELTDRQRMELAARLLAKRQLMSGGSTQEGRR